MNNHVSQAKLESVLMAIWGGNEPHHWQMVATMLYAYVLLFKNSDDNKFMQCMCLYQVANIHAKPQEPETLQTVLRDALKQTGDLAA